MREPGGFAEERGQVAPGQDLSSWKEIASYLGVSIRTAQMWERERGLPVRRLPGSHGRVIVEVVALDAWKHSGLVGAAPLQRSRVQRLYGWAKSRRKAWLGVAAAVCTLALAGTGVLWHRGGVPAGYHIDRNALVVLDGRGRELWRKEFPVAFAVNDAWRVWFGDLDGDGRTEVLFAPEWRQPGAGAALACYSQAGRERWQFTAGRAVATRKQRIASPFVVQRLVVAPFAPRRTMRIVVSSSPASSYPAQIALLGPDGALVREYWHSGWLPALLVADLNHDGRDEILAAGANRARKAAEVVVLDPDTMGGASAEEDADYQLQGLGQGREVARLLFPRSCMSGPDPLPKCDSIWRDGEEIAVRVRHRLSPEGAGVYYNLNPSLTLNRMTVSSSFEQAHAELFDRHELDHPLGAEEIAALRNVTYLGRPGSRSPAGP